MRTNILFILAVLLVLSCSNSNAGKGKSSDTAVEDPVIGLYGLEVVAEYPHDVTSYTQGLFFQDGQMYESTGLNGKSTFRKVDMATGKPLYRLDFDEKYFIEGSVIFGDNLYVLTWDTNMAFVYDAKTFSYKYAYNYPREGWGITTDGNSLIASDGSSFLYFMDADMKLEKKIQVTVDSKPLRWLNELEYIDGKIWANVYTYDEIVIIDPSNGKVEGVIDCTGLLPDELRTYDTDVLNGIAYNPEDGKIYLTGKYWPKLYEVKLVEKK